MNIIAGEWRSRVLVAPPGDATRPTSGRVREALFSHLQSARLKAGFAHLRVLDLFAGSGALALEALSRGAAHATLVESARPALSAIRQNVSHLRCEQRVSLVTGALPDVLARIPQPEPFDLVFMDPPYASNDGPATLEALPLHCALASEALIVYEHDRRKPPRVPASLLFLGERTWGDTQLSFLRPRE
jgi:16S rRNA (guanine966-N2)-methyltransferase